MKNIVVLISGRGSNLRALLETERAERWRESIGARIAAVLCNRPDAAGLSHARDAGVPAQVIDHRAFVERRAFDAALAQAIDAHDPALVVLAGFMRVLTREFVARYEGRLINIHPSLLPAFPGLATHRQALEAGVRFHGATVHFVSDQVDAGPIIGQAAVIVRPGDDEGTLAARVLAAEHVLLPRCVRLLLDGAVRLQQGRVIVREDAAGLLAFVAQ
jgi:phosphoribosylglycinamide formyltransferase-1